MRLPQTADGQVVWITGLSAAGKSTLARTLIGKLRARGQLPILLDGDEIRVAVGDPGTGHDREGRLANAMRICRLANLLSRQGFTVVVATMSLFDEVHTWNRDNLPGYTEVFIDVSLDVLKRRDPRGLYRRASQGQVSGVVGVDLEFNRPRAPHLILDNNLDGSSMDRMADEVLTFLAARAAA